MVDLVSNSEIDNQQGGSDHCPILITFKQQFKPIYTQIHTLSSDFNRKVWILPSLYPYPR